MFGTKQNLYKQILAMWALCLDTSEILIGLKCWYSGGNQLCCPCFPTPPLTETAEALQPWEMKVTVEVQSWWWKNPPPQVFCHLLFFLPVALLPATPVCEYSCLATASCQVSMSVLGECQYCVCELFEYCDCSEYCEYSAWEYCEYCANEYCTCEY